MAKHTVTWSSRPAKEDLLAARRYLILLFRDSDAKRLAERARTAGITEHVAKDLLRACRLPLLPSDEKHVAQDLKRIRKGKPLSPILIVQGDLIRDRPLVIADGYHRMCAACHTDEDAPVSAVLIRP